MTLQYDHDRRTAAFVILAIVIILIALSCNSNKPRANIEAPDKPIAGDYNPSISQESKQSSNNPWPWMIATCIQLPCFLLFLSISQSWRGKRGLL